MHWSGSRWKEEKKVKSDSRKTSFLNSKYYYIFNVPLEQRRYRLFAGVIIIFYVHWSPDYGVFKQYSKQNTRQNIKNDLHIKKIVNIKIVKIPLEPRRYRVLGDVLMYASNLFNCLRFHVSPQTWVETIMTPAKGRLL